MYTDRDREGIGTWTRSGQGRDRDMDMDRDGDMDGDMDRDEDRDRDRDGDMDGDMDRDMDRDEDRDSKEYLAVKKYIISSYSNAKNMPKVAEMKLSSCGLQKNCACGVMVVEHISLKSCRIAIAKVLPSSCGIAIADSEKSCALPTVLKSLCSVRQPKWRKQILKQAKRHNNRCFSDPELGTIGDGSMDRYRWY
jgi:hypothetical protein